MNRGRLRSIHSIAFRRRGAGSPVRTTEALVRGMSIRGPYATAMRGIRVLHRLNEEHVNVVRRIFELRAEGEGFVAIAKRPDQQLARKKALTAEQEKLQRELERLTDAIASGSGSDTVMSRIQQNERSVREIERELRGIAVPPLDEREVEAIPRDADGLAGCSPPAPASCSADAAEAARGQAGDETCAGWAQGGVRFQRGGVARQVT